MNVKYLGLLAAPALGLLAMASPAAAATSAKSEVVTAKFDGFDSMKRFTSLIRRNEKAQQTTNPNGPTTSCGTVCPGTTVWDIQAGGVFGGTGAGVFGGTTTGKVDVTKKGGVDLDLKMNGEGCADLNCANGASGFVFTGRAYENVGVIVTASGGVKDVPVTVENGGAAAVGMALQIRRLQGAPVTSGHTQD